MDSEVNFKIDSAGLWERIKISLGAVNPSDAAESLGFTKQAGYDWQKGKLPSIDTLLRIAAKGDVSLHWLITGKGQKRIFAMNAQELEIVESLAAAKGIDSEKQIIELVKEALTARGLINQPQSTELQTFLRLFDDLPSSQRREIATRLIYELFGRTGS